MVLIDGGKGQVNAAAKALSELGITDVALCGLAKRLEEVWLPHNSEPIIFPRHSEALYLLQKVRDEAHRFGITKHRDKRSKNFIISQLENIDGIGKHTAEKLLKHFGTVSNIYKAPLAELETLLGKVKANKLKEQLDIISDQ